MAAPKQKTLQDLMAGPFIFVPNSSVHSHKDDVFATLVHPNEVFWHDPTGSVQKMEEFDTQSSSSNSPINKSLCNIYPGLRGFFVDECGVQEAPPLHSYIQILLQLSTVTLPAQAADKVVTREAIYYGLSDCSFKESLINITLPYAQRYIYKSHHDKYIQLNQSGFGILNDLKVIVVQKLFYRNVIKGCDRVSNKRVKNR